ncbi:MAG: O-antigen ligase family protein [Blastocatellia bacterium]|nr:O-antigen ligase family protein [Blastocatellia bacterium]
MIVARRPLFVRTAVDLPLLVFVGWTAISVATSLDPMWSLSRMRGVSLVLIMYLFAANVPTRRVAWMLALALMLSVAGNLWWTYLERAQGRGVKVVTMGASPLKKWGVIPGDTILEVDGKAVHNLESLNAAFEGDRSRELIPVRFTHGESDETRVYRRGRVLREGTGSDRLAVTIAPGRDFRARAYFSHAATYAETLQIIASMIAAWVICGALQNRKWALWLAFLLAMTVGALVQTQTRAPIVAFGLALPAMVLLRGAGRRVLVGAGIATIVLFLAGGWFILRGREVALVHPTDESTQWRLTVWREALPILAAHPLFGIGPDAAKYRAGELQLFDGGKLPPGHFHSTPLQIAVDRGIPALIAWIAFVAMLLVSIGRLARQQASRESTGGGDWRVTATVLGAWGALVGFFASSLVHFNWGDSEPMQMAWAVAGIAFAIARIDRTEEASRELR